MLGVSAVLLAAGVILYTLWVRESDVPAASPVSPTRHLEERKAAIYDSLRDLQFEYRLGKLSEQDYQQTKNDLQRELAAVNAEMARLLGPQPPASPPPAPPPSTACPHCGAKFAQAMKFCGECGKPIRGEGA